MLNQLFTTKGDMGQLFDPKRQTVTWLNLPEQVITQVKTVATDGYSAVRVGIGQKAGKPRYQREIRLTQETDTKIGDPLPFESIIAEGDRVKATGISKGKGFAGVVKRHHFAGGPRTHGQSDRQRAPGSIGRGTTPGRVVKGQKMAGHMGHQQISVQNLKVVKLDLENHRLAISGAIPGAKNGLIRLTVTRKHA